MRETQNLSEYVEKLPPPEEVRLELARNLREQRLLKQLLRLAEQKAKVQEVDNE